MSPGASGRWGRAVEEVVAIAGASGAGSESGDDPADEYEYRPLRFDASTSRAAAAVMLSIQAEYGGWELARVLRFPDGSRRVTVRRHHSAGAFPALSL